MDSLGPYLLGPNDTSENGIYTGDARELAKAIPDESIDLIFTDPVYDRIDDYKWLAETGARVLKDRKSVLAFCPHVMFDAAIGFRDAGLRLNPLLDHAPNGSCGTMWVYKLQMNGIPCLWASKGNPDNAFQMLRFYGAHLSGLRGFKWAKNPHFIAYRLEKYTAVDALTFDPFAGGGTVPAVCKMLNRKYLAFEIDPDVAQMARDRVRHTQPPLPIEMPTQEVLL